MKNFEWCAYTYRHRRILEYLVQKFIQNEEFRSEMQKRIALHDMDKILLYQVMEQRAAQDYHVETQPHHIDCKKEKSYYDLVETVLDYESAPYTKPDKPLNAFDFIQKKLQKGTMDPDLADQLLKILHEFGIDFSGTVQQDKEGQEFAANLESVTEEMILEEIESYIKSIK